jgi:teichuronic acid biosynthesis glycosyltransferase TuaC
VTAATYDAPLRVLMVTSTWPTPGQPCTTHFIKRQADFLKVAGVRVDVYHARGGRNPLRYARNWLRFRARIAPARYDLIHAQFGQSGLLALPRRLPLVVTLRGSDLLGIVDDESGRYTLQGRMLQGATRLVARHADAVVVVSEHMKRSLPPGVQATVIPSGLDLGLFRPIPQAEARQHLGLPAEGRLVLFAGRPSQARKRYELATRVMELVNRSLPTRLHVVWGVSHDEVPLHMSAGDALLFTSMQEGSPNVVKEALACDLPVVSVPVGDVAERLHGVEGCELCEDERPEALAAALERVLRRGRRSEGRQAVLALDEGLLTARLIELYRGVLRRRHGSRWGASSAFDRPSHEVVHAVGR